MGPYCNYCNRRCFLTRVLLDGRTILLATCPEGMAHDRASVGEDHTMAVNPVTDPDGAALRALYAKADRAARCTHGADCAAHPYASGPHVYDITAADVLHAVVAELRRPNGPFPLDDADTRRVADYVTRMAERLHIDAPPPPPPRRHVNHGGPGYVGTVPTGTGDYSGC